MQAKEKEDNIHICTCPFQNASELCGFSPVISLEEIEKQRLLRIGALSNLGELVKGIAHEINNPLACISGALQVLANQVNTHDLRNDKSVKEIFNGVLEQISRLEDTMYVMLKCVLDISPDPTDVRLADAINETVFMLSDQLMGKNIKVRVLHSPDQPTIQADEGLVKQVLQNIILNALDAMDDGGKLSIHTCWHAEPAEPGGRLSPSLNSDNFLKVFIRDTGCGIAPEFIEKIFMPFHTTKKKRAGISLYTSHHIIEQHKGAIHIDSKPGEGTTVVICFPLPAEPGGEQRNSNSRFPKTA